MLAHATTEGHDIMTERVSKLEMSIIKELIEVKHEQSKLNCMILKMYAEENPADCL